MLITPISVNEINIKLEKEEKEIFIQSPAEGNKITDYLKELNNELARLRSELYERNTEIKELKEVAQFRQDRINTLFKENQELIELKDILTVILPEDIETDYRFAAKGFYRLHDSKTVNDLYKAYRKAQEILKQQ